MYTQNAYQNYLENEVLVADPMKLVRLLYEGAIDAVAAARSSLQQGDIHGRSRQISKATLILNELALSLDHSKGGEISRSLTELYDYMARRLNDANFHQTDGPMQEVEQLLTTLLEGWRQTDGALPQMRGGYPPAPVEEYTPLSVTA